MNNQTLLLEALIRQLKQQMVVLESIPGGNKSVFTSGQLTGIRIAIKLAEELIKANGGAE